LQIKSAVLVTVLLIVLSTLVIYADNMCVHQAFLGVAKHG